MPEVITRHPDVAKTVLESGGATCGDEDLQPRILTECPPEGFCRFPGGELCVYSPDQVDAMTQMSPGWLKQRLDGTPSSSWFDPAILVALGIALLIGVLLGYGLSTFFTGTEPPPT